MTPSTAILYATPSRSALERRLKEGRYRQSDGQLEKRCCACGEYWPADSEFFYLHKNGPDGLRNCCKACQNEAKKATIEKHREAA